jgi:hypothetical protein
VQARLVPSVPPADQLAERAKVERLFQPHHANAHARFQPQELLIHRPANPAAKLLLVGGERSLPSEHGEAFLPKPILLLLILGVFGPVDKVLGVLFPEASLQHEFGQAADLSLTAFLRRTSLAVSFIAPFGPLVKRASPSPFLDSQPALRQGT